MNYQAPPAEHRDIAQRWAAQYKRGNVWKYRHGYQTSKQIHAELVALGNDPATSDIDRIIGNDSWTCGNHAAPIQAAPADPGIKPGGIRERAMGLSRQYREAA